MYEKQCADARPANAVWTGADVQEDLVSYFIFCDESKYTYIYGAFKRDKAVG